MFNHLSNALIAQTAGLVPTERQFDIIFQFHPLQLAAYVDCVWETLRVQPRNNDPRPQLDSAIGSSQLTGHRTVGLTDHYLEPLAGAVDITVNTAGVLDNRLFASAVDDVLGPNRLVRPSWHHLIYAYLIENTRAYEIVERVLQELVTGERLGQLSAASHRWARATEDLMYRDQGFFLSSLTSQVRRNAHATRRNAYWRMFGMDLN